VNFAILCREIVGRGENNNKANKEAQQPALNDGENGEYYFSYST
jgi:hypothetical protein